jgi:hypothetical protein
MAGEQGDWVDFECLDVVREVEEPLGNVGESLLDIMHVFVLNDIH